MSSHSTTSAENHRETEPIDLRSTTADDWRYVSEGGATIVFAYVGTPHQSLDGMVLRLRKAPLGELQQIVLPTHSKATYNSDHPPAATAEAEAAEGEEDDWELYESEPDDATIAFQSCVTSKLVPPEFLPRLLPARVSLSLLSALSRAPCSARPPERVLRDAIDTRKRRAVLATDLVGFEEMRSSDSQPRHFAVEIKPKWAFLANPIYLSPETVAVKTKYSRFVMHTYYRSLSGHASGEDSISSTYNPLDLFSGEKSRVEKAVGALWDTWIAAEGAANNLKVFVGGKVLHPTTAPPAASVPTPARTPAELLSPLLLPPSSLTNSPPLTLFDLRTPFISLLTSILLTSPLLSQLAKLQRTLDSLDIEGLAEAWRRYHSPQGSTPPPRLGEGEVDPTLEEWEAFVSMYNERNKEGTAPSALPEDGSPTSQAELRYHILAYLLSATFKDCSIMLRLPSASASSDDDESSVGRVTTIDLDPKSVARLEKWRVLDKDIAQAYAAHLRDSSQRAVDEKI